MGELWAWLRRYRVWEAARKAFLYAENWLQPERRDDKSPSEPASCDKKASTTLPPPGRSR